MPSSSTARDFVAAGRFELRSELGRGATGVVYEAWDRERGTAVAIKTLRNLGPAALLLLKKEFRALQDVQHPNLVQLGELIEDRGQWYLTMELVDGAPILAYVRPEARTAGGGDSSGRPYDEARLRGAFAELARGLVALHGAHKVHRDIKPPNVLVTRGGRTVILDFGVVTELRRDRAPEDGSLVGTVAYMAPEQAAGEAVGPAADWYAFGVVLFQALTGRLPLEGTVDEILRAKLTGAPPRPSALDASVPADLDALCARLLQTEPDGRPSGPAVLSVLEGSARDELGAERTTDVFVGRADELAALTRAFEDARTSGAVSVTVSGESGVGKSSLVRRFVEHVVRTHPGVVVFSGRCYERESVHYKGVDDLVDDLSAFLLTLPERELAETVPTHAGLLARAFPVLQQVPGFELTPDVDEALVPRELRERVFQAARELLTRIARGRPVIGFIDDLQWADADSLALLGEVLREPDAPPMLLLATVRTGTETRRRLKGPTFELAGDVRTLHVEKLPARDAEELVLQLLAGSGVDARDARAIAAEAKGHPLFIDELVRTRGAGGGGLRDVIRLDDALWARVQALGPTAQTLLELLCVIGSPVSQEVAARAAAISWGTLFDAVTTLRAERLVRIDGARPEDAIAPYHDRVRESVVARLDAESRRAWHAHFAAALENTREEDPEALAFHWLEGGNPQRARDYAVRAAENAARSFAFDRAAELYRAALGMGPEDDRAALLERCWAEALSNAGRDAEAARVWLRLASKADPAAAVSLRQSAAEAFLCSGHFEQGQEVLEDVVRAAGLYMPKTPAGALLLLVLLRIVLAVRGLGFVAREEREADSGARMRLDAAWSAARGLVMHDNVRGLYFQMHSLLGALNTGDRRRLVRTLAMEAMAGGAPDKARTHKLLVEARRHAEALATPYELGMAEFAEGGVRYFWGEWAAAVELLLRAESIFRERCVGVTWELTSAHLMLNSSMTYCGRLRELAVRLPTLLREADKRNDRYALVNLRTTGTSILGFAQGRTEAVAEMLERQLAELTPDAFRVQHYLCLYALVNVDLHRGEPAAAHARITAAWPAMKRAMLLRVPIILIQSLEQRCRAAVAWAAKEPAVAPERLREADGLVRALERLGRAFPWASVMATATKACVARVRRAPDDVVAAALLDAAAASERHGMALVAWNLLLTRSKLLGLEREHEELAARMRDEGIVEPMGLAAMFVPGFGDGR